VVASRSRHRPAGRPIRPDSIGDVDDSTASFAKLPRNLPRCRGGIGFTTAITNDADSATPPPSARFFTLIPRRREAAGNQNSDDANEFMISFACPP
jgi:hypothetical protein